MIIMKKGQTINQHLDGFSIVNLQWASFASGATVIIPVAIVGVLVTLCCYFRARNDRRSKERHHQLIETISGWVLPRRKPSSRAHPLSSWIRCRPTWCSATTVRVRVVSDAQWRLVRGTCQPPSHSQHALPAILAAAGGQVHGIQQLPFPGFPSVHYQPAGLFLCGMPGCQTSGLVTYQACPAISCDQDLFTEIRDEPQPQQQPLQPRQASSQSSVADYLPPFPRREILTSRQSRVSFSES